MFNEELISAKVAARNAGKILMKYYESSDKEIKMKGANNPVTVADQEADKYLFNFLTNEFPEYGWLSEETLDTQERLEKNRVWVVDPLDGTKEFIEGVPHFSISIGMVSSGKSVVGVIYNPAKNELFSAYKGGGSMLNEEPIYCLSDNSLRTIMVSRSEIKRGMWKNYEEKFSEIIPIGSVAYKLGLIAAGKATFFATLQPKNEWDVCAGDCILSEAGGSLIDLYGKNRSYNLIDTRIRPGLIAGYSDHLKEVLETINI